MTPCIVGIDPGQSGALAFYFPESPGRVAVEDMPVAGDHVDAAGLAQRIAQLRPDLAVVESVHSMPNQGVASSFRFGRSFGVVIGVVAALHVPAHFVAPGRWKKHFRLSSDKDQARALALQLWPVNADRFQRKRDADRAEAALIARFGAEVILRPVSEA
jgi:crossover junction endodeoxyribonuclease RuvC